MKNDDARNAKEVARLTKVKDSLRSDNAMMKRTMDNLRLQIDTLQKDITISEENNRKLTKTIERLQEECNNLMSSKENLMSSKEKCDITIKTHIITAHKLQQENNNLNKTLKDMKIQYAELSDKNKQCNKSYDKICADNENNIAQLNDFKNINQQCTKKIEKLENEKQEWDEERSKYILSESKQKEQIVRLRKEVMKLIDENKKAWEENNKLIDGEIFVYAL